MATIMRPNRTTDAAYSHEEAWEIRRILEAPHARPVCPRCGDPLTSDLPVPGAEGSTAVHLLRCGYCRRYVVFDDLGTRAAPNRRRTL